MKFLITQEQFDLLNEVYRRDTWDAEYADEYPKYKNMFIKTLKKDVTSWGEAHNSIYLIGSDGQALFAYRKKSKDLYYDYSVDREMEEVIPYHIVSRHLRNAVYDYFKGMFPDVEIKDVSGANIG